MFKYLIKIILLTVIIFLAAKIGTKFPIVEGNISLIWPPTGIGIAILLLHGKQLFPGIGIGVFLATASTGVGLQFALGAAFANTVEAWLAVWLIQYLYISYQLNRVRDLLIFLIVVMLITPIIASLIGSSSFCLTFSCSQNDFIKIALTWWFGNAMGALVITPLILSWGSNREIKLNQLNLTFNQDVINTPKKQLITIVGFSLLVIANLLVFGIIEISFLELNNYPLQYLCFPFLIWAAFSFKQRGATTAIFLTVVIAVLGIIFDVGVFAKTSSVNSRLFVLWSFITVVSLPTLILAAAVTEKEVAENNLEHFAYHDFLTGLPNRGAFFQKISHFLKECKINSKQNYCSVLFIDLNHFKEINNTFGHYLGDQLIGAIGKRLKASISDTHFIARLGGDEFGIFIPEINQSQDAILLSEQISEQLKSPFLVEDCKFLVGASIGIALGSCEYEKGEDLLRDADIAMYQAKVQQQRYCIFQPKMREKIISQLQLDQALQQAISNQELSVAYQPIVALPTSQVIGFECLLRWYNQEKENWISPHRFIQIAERTELIKEIGEWVLIQACQQLQAWQERFTNREITVSVNVSPKQLQDEMLVDQVKKAIESYQINPNCLRLEVTETAILEANAKSILEDLKAIGVKLYLDDFGIGESSLSRLYQLPLDVIKIDKAFVLGIPENRRKSAIVRTIITLADNLELDLIAEGVETEIQSQSLLEWGCQKGQGFLFSRPISASEATEMIRE